MSGYGGVEYIIRDTGRGPINKSHHVYNATFVGRITEYTKIKNGKQVFSAKYTVDDSGFRISPSANLKGKTKHFFLIDGSIAFGEGLNDNETIHQIINKRSKIYEAYTLGLPGEGPQHNWLRFNSLHLKDQVSQKTGSALFITHEADIGKFTGAVGTLPFGRNFPRLIEQAPGKYYNAGTFLESGTFLQKMLLNHCIPYNFCNDWLSKLSQPISNDEIAAGARLINELDKKYREQFKVENSKVLWLGSEPGRRIFKLNSNLEVIRIFYNSFEGDAHPNKEGAEEIADALFRKKLVN